MRRAGKFLSGLFGMIGGAKAISEALAPDSPAEARRLQGQRSQQQPQIADGRRVVSGDVMRLRKFDIKSIDDRVAVIVKLAQEGRDHPEIHRFVANALNQKKANGDWEIAEGDYQAEVAAIFYAVRRNVRYVHDPIHTDLFQHPLRTLELGKGDCDDFCSLIGACMNVAGFPAKARVIQTKGAPDWDHIYNMVGIPPESPHWYPIDASIDRPPGWQLPKSQVRRVKDFPID